MALGDLTSASGTNSTAVGNGTNASEAASPAMGVGTEVSGNVSTATVSLATCLLKDLSKRLITDCSNECPDESNKEIIEDFRLTESLLSQFFMIRNCAEAEGKDPDYSKIELALNNLIEKYQCLGCQTYTEESISPDGPTPED